MSKTVGLQAAMRRNCFRSGLVWQQPEGYVDFKNDVNADMTEGELERALVARNGESLSGPVRFLVGRLCVSLPIDMIGTMVEDGFRKSISRAADGPDRQEYPIIIEERNRRALSMILESDFTSAYVTYGRNHFKGLAAGLSHEGWTEVRRTEYQAW